MSVLINGMEMPTNCYDCPFIRQSFGGDFYCAKGNGSEDDIKKVYSKRMDDCPLVELPTPHGRLIDIKSLEDNKFETVDNDLQRWWNGAIDSIINNAPTVIEAEGVTK